MTGKSLLLVEDDAIIGMGEQQELEKKGYRVKHVFNGEKAVAAVLEGEDYFDAVLMDIDLGRGMDGTEASEKILAEKDIPIIFLSAHREPDIVEKTEKITSYGYVVKNSGIIVLDASIKMALKLFEEKKTRAAMAHMLDVAPNSVTIHDTEGNFLYANAKTFELHGYTEEEFMAINLHDLDVPESEALLEERFRLIFNVGSATFRVAHFRKDGSAFPLEVSTKIVDWQGRRAVLSIATDITERKQSEDTLRTSEERVQALLNVNPDLMFLFDRQGRFIDAHAGDAAKFFIPPSRFLERHVSEVLSEELARLTMEKLDLLFKKMEPLIYEYSADSRGEKRLYETRLVLCGTDKGLAIVRDITEEKRALDYRLRSQEWFKKAFEASALGFCFVDLRGRFIKVNDSFTAILGYSEEELLSVSFSDITHPEDRQIGNEYFHRLIEGEIDKAIFEKRYIHKNGAVVPVSVATTLIRDDQGDPQYFVTQVLDRGGTT